MDSYRLDRRMVARRQIPGLMLACVLAAACSEAPILPTAPSRELALPPVTSQANLASCLGGSGDASCFSGGRLSIASTALAATAPGAPGTLTSTVTGSAVTLAWSAPTAGDPVVTYVLEAGLSPGASNLANFATNSTTPSFSTGGVPAGTYYVRVRAQNASGVSPASNEVVVVVGSSGGCNTAPGAPGGLAASVNGTTLTLRWNAPAGGCAPTSYILQAGSASGLSNLRIVDLGSAATTFIANSVPAGTFYLRMLASNAHGQSGPSNEVVATIGGGAPPPTCDRLLGGEAAADCLPPFGTHQVAGFFTWTPNPCNYPNELWRFELFVGAVGDRPELRDFTSLQLGGRRIFTRLANGNYVGELNSELLGASVRGTCYPTTRPGSTIMFRYNGDGSWTVELTIIVDGPDGSTPMRSVGRATLR